MTYDSVVNEFLNAFPEYKGAYDEHFEYNNEMLPHVFFGETLNEDLPVLLMKHSDKEKLKNVFNFMERMATEGDIHVHELLSATILARLGDDPKLLKVATVYMGDKTEIASGEIEKLLGRHL